MRKCRKAPWLINIPCAMCDCEHGNKTPKPAREFPDVTHELDLSELRYLIENTQNEELSKAFEKLWEAVNQNADHAFMLIKVNS